MSLKNQPPAESPSVRITTPYKKLSATAADLNAVSDELGKSITVLDSAIKKLNLGVATWIVVQEWGDQSGEYYTEHRLGYAKVGNKWGIALATADGSHNWPDQENFDSWLFNEAPRNLRIKAVDKIPDLLTALVKEGEKTTEKLKATVAHAKEFAATIEQLAAELGRK